MLSCEIGHQRLKGEPSVVSVHYVLPLCHARSHRGCPRIGSILEITKFLMAFLHLQTNDARSKGGHCMLSWAVSWDTVVAGSQHTSIIVSPLPGTHLYKRNAIVYTISNKNQIIKF